MCLASLGDEIFIIAGGGAKAAEDKFKIIRPRSGKNEDFAEPPKSNYKKDER